MMAFYPTLMVLRFAKCVIPMATIPYIVTLVHRCVNQYYYGDKCLKRLQEVCCGDSVQDRSDYSAQQSHLYIANSGLWYQLPRESCIV